MKENTSRNTKNIDSLLGAVQVTNISLSTTCNNLQGAHIYPVCLHLSPVSACTNPCVCRWARLWALPGAAPCTSVARRPRLPSPGCAARLLVSWSIVAKYFCRFIIFVCAGNICPGLALSCTMCGIFTAGLCGPACTFAGLYCGVAGYSC